MPSPKSFCEHKSQLCDYKGKPGVRTRCDVAARHRFSCGVVGRYTDEALESNAFRMREAPLIQYARIAGFSLLRRDDFR